MAYSSLAAACTKVLEDAEEEGINYTSRAVFKFKQKTHLPCSTLQQGCLTTKARHITCLTSPMIWCRCAISWKPAIKCSPTTRACSCSFSSSMTSSTALAMAHDTGLPPYCEHTPKKAPKRTNPLTLDQSESSCQQQAEKASERSRTMSPTG